MIFSSKLKRYFALSMFVLLALSTVIFLTSCSSEKTGASSLNKSDIENANTGGTTASSGGDLIILKSEVSETAKFYPYEVDGTKVEVIAVKASDGTIRTAFNTCQVCFDSGRGYYRQEGNELVCQNCKNRFKIDQVEKIKGGCNPVPILKENKTEDANNITISKGFLLKNKSFFENWKK